MKVGLQMLNGSTLLGTAEVVNNGCTFLRNLVLARLLSKEDFGIAATLALVVTLFELAGRMSFSQQVIQSPSGDEPAFLQSSHACQALAGIVSAALIVSLSYPLAHLFGIGTHWEALMLLTIIPLCTGFGSLEIYRLVRHLRFGPLVLADMAPQILITLAAWPLAAWLRDYRAILCLLLVKSVFSLVASHVLAERPYRLSWQPQLMYESFRFGWPLLASGFLLFGVFQGDRMLIAGAYSMSDLGVYAVASTLAMAPMFTLYKVFGPVSLPVLARAQRDLPKFRTFYGLSAQALALCGTVFVVAMILGGETVITLLFGEKYREAGVLAAWLTVGQSVRILRAAPTNAALAKGDTVNSFLSNLWRLLGLGLAVPVVLFKLDLRWIAVAGGLGELLALGASLVRLRRKHNVPFGDCLCPGILMLILTLTAFLVRGGSAPTHIASTLALAVLGCAVSLTVFGVVFADLRRVSFSLLSDVRLRLTNISQNARLRRAANRA